MIRLCETCGHYYDDEQSWTICPHGPFWAAPEAYCRQHDLVNCKLHDDPAPAPRIPGTGITYEVSSGVAFPKTQMFQPAPASPEVEGRYFFYNFDFLRFRKQAEESIRPVNDFLLQGVCWKFKFHGGIKLWIKGELIVDLITKEHADACPLVVPHPVKVEDEVCVQVADYQRRRFQWFRPNTARVTLAVIEQPTRVKIEGEIQKFSQ